MLPELLPSLRCPQCLAPLRQSARSLSCVAGHTYDEARQGYVSLLAGPARVHGDDAPMVQARETFLSRGHFLPLMEALAELVAQTGPPEGLLVEIGAGPGAYLAFLLQRLSSRAGLAIDISKHAAKRAARAHPRLGAIVADARARLPLADGSAALGLCLFAPRAASEFHRVLAPGAPLIVAIPDASHLGELRAPLGLLSIDAEKETRLARTLEPNFTLETTREIRWTMRLSRDDAALVALMGPSAFHLDRAALAARLLELPEPSPVSGSVKLALFRRLG